jgi:hypothetical protein
MDPLQAVLKFPITLEKLRSRNHIENIGSRFRVLGSAFWVMGSAFGVQLSELPNLEPLNPYRFNPSTLNGER